MITGAVPPVLHEESYGLPAFARDYNSDYQTVLRRRDDWNPIVSGDISTLASRAGRVVVGVDSTIAVKYTCFDNRGEFHALEDISRIAGIRVPRPILHWDCPSSGRYAVSMTMLPGKSLDDNATYFDPSILDEVSKSLRSTIASVRTLTSPTIRGPGDNLVRSSLLRCHGAKFSGVDDGTSVIEYLIRTYGSSADCSSASRVRESYSRYLDNLPDRQDLCVMTHSDLHPSNVVIEETGCDTNVGLVDWERASYMPLYWEHLSACIVKSVPLWRSAVISATVQYPDPVEAILDMIREGRRIRHYRDV